MMPSIAPEATSLPSGLYNNRHTHTQPVTEHLNPAYERLYRSKVTHISHRHDELAPGVQSILLLAFLHTEDVDPAIVAASGQSTGVSREGQGPHVHCMCKKTVTDTLP